MLDKLFTFSVVVIVALSLGFSMGGCTGQMVTRNRAIANGVAEWVCDPQTGETTFRWRKP